MGVSEESGEGGTWPRNEVLTEKSKCETNCKPFPAFNSPGRSVVSMQRELPV